MTEVLAFTLRHPLGCVLAAAIVAVMIAALRPERGPLDGDDDNPNGANWP